MEEVEEMNAIIDSVRLTNDDHGILTAWINLKYANSGQGFGGYVLYTPSREGGDANYTGHFIWRVMEIADVTEWSKLPGRPVRARASFSKVHEIGHILKDKWFNPTIEFERMQNELSRYV